MSGPLPHAVGSGGPVADAIDGQDRRFFETGEVVTAGCMRKMMIEDFDTGLRTQVSRIICCGLACGQPIEESIRVAPREDLA